MEEKEGGRKRKEERLVWFEGMETNRRRDGRCRVSFWTVRMLAGKPISIPERGSNGSDRPQLLCNFPFWPGPLQIIDCIDCTLRTEGCVHYLQREYAVMLVCSLSNSSVFYMAFLYNVRICSMSIYQYVHMYELCMDVSKTSN